MMMQNQDVDFDEDEGEMLPLLCWSHEDRSKTKTWDQEGPQSVGLENIV